MKKIIRGKKYNFYIVSEEKEFFKEKLFTNVME